VAELAQRGLWALALAVLVMNLPFGFWRAGAKRFTRPWFVAVHAPVPFVILLRVVSGLGWHLVSFPVLIGAFFTGQFLGGAMRRR
jgi:F0F1-type ATP synthase membrane subunit a